MKDKLNIGDRCWFYRNALVHFVDIVAIKSYCVGEPIEFHMYDVKRVVGRDVVDQGVHRSMLFRCPIQRPELITELDSDRDRLERYVADLEFAEREVTMPDPDKDDV